MRLPKISLGVALTAIGSLALIGMSAVPASVSTGGHYSYTYVVYGLTPTDAAAAGASARAMIESDSADGGGHRIVAPNPGAPSSTTCPGALNRENALPAE
jgi:hypothetical protein